MPLKSAPPHRMSPEALEAPSGAGAAQGPGAHAASPAMETAHDDEEAAVRSDMAPTVEAGIAGALAEGTGEAEGPATEEKPFEPTEEQIECGREALRRIIDEISPGAGIQVDTAGRKLLYRIEGGNSAILIGKRGQTLEAIQYLIEKIVNKKGDNRVRVQIDVEGYLDRRKESLEKHASRLLAKVKKTGKPVTVGHMNAYERRIVHIALREESDIRTQSIGDGLYRKLMIFPKRQNQRRPRS